MNFIIVIQIVDKNFDHKKKIKFLLTIIPENKFSKC